MDTYGLKITVEGESVLDDSLELNKYIMHSSYPLLEVYSYGTFTNNFVGPGEDTFIINHDLEFPFVLVYMQNYDGISDTISSEYYQLDWSTAGATYENYAEARTGDGTLTIVFNDSNLNKFVQLKGFYYIFKNILI
ncbi:MAG: hypothetical protein M0Q27_03515 [Candidatus Colwellbacteria bacterium]|jgi:hypothetical protein|nr:hypothetical protein [Candidatus Colwellbacteria bacterium]